MTNLKFGQRVRLTRIARECGVRVKGDGTGVVVHVEPEAEMVRVHIEGRVMNSRYCADFWEPVIEESPARPECDGSYRGNANGRCGQCGKAYTETACGPTHACILAHRLNCPECKAPTAQEYPPQENSGTVKTHGFCHTDCEHESHYAPTAEEKTLWKCACGWRGPSSALRQGANNTCPDCGGSGGLILDDAPTAQEKRPADWCDGCHAPKRDCDRARDGGALKCCPDCDHHKSPTAGKQEACSCGEPRSHYHDRNNSKVFDGKQEAGKDLRYWFPCGHRRSGAGNLPTHCSVCGAEDKPAPPPQKEDSE